ncbi:MAG: hypothetical protein KME32_10475 [Mojavia pulchra JT2-VF2]|jgi:hypothetical protein|uniref:Uncharacterized protein n=1 Tax=Mojavia pulchra JT2-VF2 TaxID=287848 RepID=A0A951UGY8_9NOST|nr:hypothetical protein [Mojavia pulchra JT2-VF2]
MAQNFPRLEQLQALWFRSKNVSSFAEVDNLPIKGIMHWGKTQFLTSLTTLFKKAEAVHATPQDLSIVLRWAGGMCFLAGPATLD